MALVINTNIASITAQRNLSTNASSLEKSVSRLSSGLRINTAADDAAGLSISEKLRANIRSVNQAVRNAQDGISLMQTAEGGLTEIGSILTRMRELAEQSSNGTLDSSARSALDSEFTQLISEIDRIGKTTEFNGVKLLDGSQSATGVTLQVGFRATTNDQLVVLSGILSGLTSSSSLASALGIGGTFSSISTATAAVSALLAIDSAINTVAQNRGTLGSVQNRLNSTISNLQVASENFSAADSRIRDADFASETATFTKNQIMVQAATSILAQANVLPQQALTLLR
ncbi:MAG: flagellin FliC [Nitrospiraceae bacterium]|nr:flagellin FliC [Nitrospiraceae bacterium]